MHCFDFFYNLEISIEFQIMVETSQLVSILTLNDTLFSIIWKRIEIFFVLRNISSLQGRLFIKKERVLMDVSLLSSDMRKFSHDMSFPFYPKSSFLLHTGEGANIPGSKLPERVG